MGPGAEADTFDMLGVGASMEGLGAVAGPSPTPGFPTSGDPRQQTYKWPDGTLVNGPSQIRKDASMLRALNFPAPDTGNAYDPAFRAAVAAYQSRAGLTSDGLIGPETRSSLEEAYGLVSGGASDLSADNGGGGGGGGLLSVHTSDGQLDTKKVALLGLGAAAVVGVIYFATR